MASMAFPPLTIPGDGSKSFVAPPRAFIARMGPDDSFAHSLPNAWFASTIPGHPFWLLPLRFAADRVAGGETGGPEWITGPVGVFESEKIWRDVSDDLIDDPLLQGVEGELVIVPAVSTYPRKIETTELIPLRRTSSFPSHGLRTGSDCPISRGVSAGDVRTRSNHRLVEISFPKPAPSLVRPSLSRLLSHTDEWV
jgi:hypothetical protein